MGAEDGEKVEMVVVRGVKERGCVGMVPFEGQRGEGLGPCLLSPSRAILHVGPPNGGLSILHTQIGTVPL